MIPAYRNREPATAGLELKLGHYYAVRYERNFAVCQYLGPDNWAFNDNHTRPKLVVREVKKPDKATCSHPWITMRFGGCWPVCLYCGDEGPHLA